MKTETKVDNTQVKKFNERVVKSRGKNPNAATVIKRFNFIDLTHAIAASESKPKKSEVVKTRFKMTPTKEKNWVIPQPETMTIETMPGSVSRFINECHPDVQKFINKGEIKSIKAGAGELLVRTKNGMRVLITVTGYRQRHIKITHGRKTLFDGATTVKVERIENEKKAKAA